MGADTVLQAGIGCQQGRIVLSLFQQEVQKSALVLPKRKNGGYGPGGLFGEPFSELGGRPGTAVSTKRRDEALCQVCRVVIHVPTKARSKAGEPSIRPRSGARRAPSYVDRREPHTPALRC